MAYNIRRKKVKQKVHPLLTENTERMFKIIVPIRDNSGRPIKLEERKKIALKMAQHFGGVTIERVSGIHKEGKRYVFDDSLMFSGGRDVKPKDKPKSYGIFENDKAYMQKMAKKLALDYGQGTMLIESDVVEDIEFIKGKERKKAIRSVIGGQTNII
jgi:hypothetical protein